MEDKLKKYKEILDDTPGTLQVGWEWSNWLWKLDNEIKPKTYVEIGIEYGGALATINKTLPYCRLIGVDLKRPQDAVSNEWGDKYEHHFEFLKGNSHDLQTWKQLMVMLKGERADVLFIDGAHFFDDVYKDWIDYGPLAKIVAFHDIVDSPYARRGSFYVHFLWEYLKTQYRSEEIIASDENRNNPEKWGGIGVLYLKDKLGNYPLPTDYNE